MLRPLTPDGRRPKTDRELNDGERHNLQRQRDGGRNLRTERGTQRDRREK
jgi:hypothetical protein